MIRHWPLSTPCTGRAWGACRSGPPPSISLRPRLSRLPSGKTADGGPPADAPVATRGPCPHELVTQARTSSLPRRTSRVPGLPPLETPAAVEAPAHPRPEVRGGETAGGVGRPRPGGAGGWCPTPEQRQGWVGYGHAAPVTTSAQAQRLPVVHLGRPRPASTAPPDAPPKRGRRRAGARRGAAA